MDIKELLKTNKNFQIFMEALRSPIIYCSMEGKINDANDLAISIMRLDQKHYLGTSLFEHCKKNNFSLINLLNQNFNEDLKETYPIHNRCCTILWKKVLFSVPTDKEKSILLIGTDITNEEAISEKLQDETFFYENILSKLPTNVYWKDKNGVYMGCNDRLAKVTGLSSRHEIKGMTDFDFDWGNGAAEKFIAFDKTVMATDKSMTTEDIFKEKSGRTVTVLTNKTPLKDKNGETIGVLAISVDITERKQMEEELRKAHIAAEASNKAKSGFIANISHDLRTPLTGILGLTQELIDVADKTQISLQQSSTALGSESSPKDSLLLKLLKELTETVQEDGQLLISSADELLQLLNEILETMRLESGKVSEKLESFDLRELINHNVELMQPIARHRKLELISEMDEQLPVYFSGIRNYLDRSILNLMSNALKFTDKGFVKVKVELHSEPKRYQLGDAIELKISVQDTGIGIPEDKFTTIFEHFSRLNPSYQGLYKGAGLGLYTVRQYIEAMQAKIRVESEVGKGTNFVITLPLTVSDYSDRKKVKYRVPSKKIAPPSQTTITNHQKEIAKSEAKISLLIVEDNPIAARSVKNSLKRLDSCASDIAGTGKDATKMVQKDHYDLILMDIGLPDMDGIEVTRQIRALDHQASQIPIVALTGHGGDTDIKEEALTAGMQDVFTKPLQIPKLETLLERYVYHSKQEYDLTEQETKQQPEVSNKIIDWEANLFNLNGDEEFLRELFSILSLDLKITEETIDKAYKMFDNQALREELHRVRGGVSYLVLPQLDNALSKFHEAVREKPKNTERLETTYVELKQAIKSFQEAWEKL